MLNFQSKLLCWKLTSPILRNRSYIIVQVKLVFSLLDPMSCKILNEFCSEIVSCHDKIKIAKYLAVLT